MKNNSGSITFEITIFSSFLLVIIITTVKIHKEIHKINMDKIKRNLDELKKN